MENERQEPARTSDKAAGDARLGYRTPVFVEYGDLAARTHTVGKTGLADGGGMGAAGKKTSLP